MPKSFNISVVEAREILKNEHVILVDIRDTESYDLSHAKSALNLTNENISTFITDTPKDNPIMVMCYHGVSSRGVAEYLTMQGFDEVYSVDGGYEMWKLTSDDYE